MLLTSLGSNWPLYVKRQAKTDLEIKRFPEVLTFIGLSLTILPGDAWVLQHGFLTSLAPSTFYLLCTGENKKPAIELYLYYAMKARKQCKASVCSQALCLHYHFNS